MKFSKRSKIVLSGAREKERGQARSVINADGAVVDIPAAKLILRRDVVVHGGGQVLVIGKVRSLDRYKSDVDGRNALSRRIRIGDEDVVIGIWRTLPGDRIFGLAQIGCDSIGAVAGNGRGPSILLQNAQVRSRDAGTNALNGRVSIRGRGAQATGHNAGLPDGSILEVGKVEQLVLQYRTTDLAAEAIIIEARVLCAFAKGLDYTLFNGVEVSILEVAEGLAVDSVSTALDDGIELAGVGMPELRAELVRKSGEFLNRVVGNVDEGAGD